MTESTVPTRTPVAMGMYRCAVRAVRDLTPHLRRITLAGHDLRQFRDDGPDQRVKLLLPRSGQDRPIELPAEGWYRAWQTTDPAVRPVLRTYTVRASRPADGEVDLDMVLHGDAGPASAWAARARAGAQVTLFGPRAEWAAERAVGWHLLVADHTALPALGAILEGLPDAARGVALAEVPGPDDELLLAVPRGMSLRWLHAEPGSAALAEAVEGLDLSDADGEPGPAAWIAGEKAVAVRIRRRLVNDLGWDPDRVTFSGYWRRGAAVDPT